MDAFEFAESQRTQFLEELKSFLRIPSVSAKSEHKPDMRRAAEWTADQLRKAGLTAQLYETPGHPIVYGEWLGASGTPTVIIYGHYDVQPVEPIQEWRHDPFEPTLEGNNLLARGASDDKGQVFVNIKAIQSLAQAGGRLPFNVKFLVEGEEEVGSTNLDNFIKNHQDLLRADVGVISDSAMLALDRPSVVYALRGMTYLEIEVWGPDHDLHSGQYGGSVHNPAQALCEILAALHNSDGSIAVKGFYDKVRPLDKAEREALAKVPMTEAEWKKQTGAPAPWGEVGYTISERVGGRPTLEVNGLVGGWTGQGAKTVLPAKALAKVSCRLVANQDPYEIENLVRAHVLSIAPPAVKVEVRALNYGYPAIVPIDTPAMKAAVAAYERGFGARPVFMREGGSIPVVATFQQLFGIPVLLTGYGLPDDRLHSPNEKFNLECFYRGITTAIALYDGLSKIPLKELTGKAK